MSSKPFEIGSIGARAIPTGAMTARHLPAPVACNTRTGALGWRQCHACSKATRTQLASAWLALRRSPQRSTSSPWIAAPRAALSCL